MIWKVSSPYLRRHWGAVVLIVLLQLVATVSALALPDMNAEIINNGVMVGDVATVWRLGGVMLAISALQGLAAGFAVYYAARIAMGLGAYLRGRVFDHVQELSAREVHDFGAPTLITRATNDVQQIQMVVLMIFNFMITAPIMGVGGVVMALRLNMKLAWVLAVVVPLTAIIVVIAFRILNPLFLSQQERLDRMNTVLREELTGIRVIRAFNREDEFEGRYTSANTALKHVALRVGAVFAVLFPLLQLVASAGSVAVLWFGGQLIDTGQMEVGTLFAYISYLFIIFNAVMMAAMMFFMLPRATVTARRINDVLETDSSVVPAQEDKRVSLPDTPLTFSLAHATVQYPGAEEPVLQNVDVVLRPGTTTAVIGATGSGKSTLANLFPRLMDPSSGTVLADGIDVRQIDPLELRERIGFVPQTSYLFSGTVASTVSGVENPDEQQLARVTRSLKGSASTEFVANLDGGLDHSVEAGGKNFSGGQRQRLTMARALYRKADLYIFDDSFSALDYATDAQIRNSLREYVGEAAVLIVGQRVATIRHADRILVLEDGHVVGQGTHSELLRTCPTYQQIVDSQESREEAA
ncbi:ABC transporter ATP-binding protein [Actinomycetaceae bacterium MB13-C1-2]|nr:ABC transporter ATP-binding protein [Actinomycetaceae bacterium MB13-C1-2]